MLVDVRASWRAARSHLRGPSPKALPPQETLWGWIRAALAFQPARPEPDDERPGASSLNHLGRVHAQIAAESDVVTVRGTGGEGPPAEEMGGMFQLDLRRGTALLAEGHYDAAIACFSAVLEAAPDHALALASRAAARRMLGRNDAAIRDASRAIALQPDLAWAYATRGAIHRLQAKYREALVDLNRAIELQPDYEWCLAGRGETHRLMGQHQQALVDLNRALELNPRNDWALMCRGAVYLDTQEEQLALRAFREAVSVNPDADWALGLPALTYRLMGRDLTRYTEDPRGAVSPTRTDPEVRISQLADGVFRVVDPASSATKITASWAEAVEAVHAVLTGSPLRGKDVTRHVDTPYASAVPAAPAREVRISQITEGAYRVVIPSLSKIAASFEELDVLTAESLASR